MKEETALILAEEINPMELFSSGEKVAELLDLIRAKALSVVADASTAEGRSLIKSTAYKISRTKTIIIGAGDEYIGGLKEKVAAYNSLARHIKTGLDEFKTEYRKPLTDWEEEEKKIQLEKQAALEKKAREQEQLIKALGATRNLILKRFDVSFPVDFLGSLTEDEFDAKLIEAEQTHKDRTEKAEAEAKAREQEQLNKTLGATRNKILGQFDVSLDPAYLGSLAEDEFDAKLIEAEQIHKDRTEKAEAEAKARERTQRGMDRFAELKRYGMTEWSAQDLADMPVDQYAQICDDSRIEHDYQKREEAIAAHKAKEQAQEAKRKKNDEHRLAIQTAAAAGLSAIVDNNTAMMIIEHIDAGNVPHVSIGY